MIKSKDTPEIKIEEEQQKKPSINIGKWTEEENLKYVIFLDLNKAKFFAKKLCRYFSKDLRKKNLFEKMSVFIRTRTTIQCQTHHQKYEGKFGSSRNIIEIFKDEVGHSLYKKYVKKMKNSRFSQNDSSEIEQRSAQNLKQLRNIEDQKKEIGIQTDISLMMPLFYQHSKIKLEGWNYENWWGLSSYF